MKKYYNQKFNKYVYELFAGNYFATKEKDVILATLLGSCVAACLRDKKAGVVGMNHFLLPGDISREEVFLSSSSKYGLYAMEMLINSMMKLGADRANIEAKVFGGGHVLNSTSNKIPDNNVSFIKAYLSMENIPVVSEDVGGNLGRKILFFADTTDVYLKRISREKVHPMDEKFLKQVKKKGDTYGEVTLFE